MVLEPPARRKQIQSSSGSDIASTSSGLSNRSLPSKFQHSIQLEKDERKEVNPRIFSIEEVEKNGKGHMKKSSYDLTRQVICVLNLYIHYMGFLLCTINIPIF